MIIMIMLLIAYPPFGYEGYDHDDHACDAHDDYIMMFFLHIHWYLVSMPFLT